MNTGRNTKKIKITVDTNILISVFVYPGTTVVRIFDDIFDGKILLGLSDEILREFTGVCVRKFDYDAETAVKYSDLIRRHSVIVYPTETVNIIKDEPDNRILECADEFKADYIISGDRHLLDVKKYKNIKIITPADFIKTL
ncbi:MAG: putative toxin-antitoxin system toxin component, PIN family [Candidatus Goldiibacteriota bacterium HGW-Goldbacteria-1]|nr:MAG: putative toxin-antitoxin system toxin component, PIN family [Candidatus Goldiibacteriota bacterium HGW-Goldbacteria-1]